MMHDARHPSDESAERTTRLLSHLDGVLDATMLDAMHGAWAMLERSATDSPSHARAVRSRMLWETMDPAAQVLVADLVVGFDDAVHDELDDDEDAEALRAA